MTDKISKEAMDALWKAMERMRDEPQEMVTILTPEQLVEYGWCPDIGTAKEAQRRGMEALQEAIARHGTDKGQDTK